jgi:CubicO group peptidase (beta-lactamase class C family)
MANAHGNLFTEPGAQHAYTNIGYGILDLLIAKIAGPPGAYVSEAVAEPLGLSTLCIGPRFTADGPLATRYTTSGHAYPEYDTSHRGASLGWASAADLARFGQSQLGHRSRLDAATRQEMTSPASAASPRYGLGWVTTDVRGHRVVSHSGAMGGVDSALVVVPALGLSLGVVVNQMWSVASSVVEWALDRLIPPNGEAAIEQPRLDLCRVRAGRWSGAVETPDGRVDLAVEVDEGGQVSAGFGGSPMERGEVGPSYHLPAGIDLGANFDVTLPVSEAQARSPKCYLALEQVGDKLVGAVRALPAADDRDGWFGNCFSYWCELPAV